MFGLPQLDYPLSSVPLPTAQGIHGTAQVLLKKTKLPAFSPISDPSANRFSPQHELNFDSDNWEEFNRARKE